MKLGHCLAALAACALSGPALAGNYMGVALSQNTVGDWDDVGPALDDGSFTSQRSEDTDSGFRVFGGAGDPGGLAFEIGYSDFGEATFKAQSNGCCLYPQGPVNVSAAASGLDLGVIGRAALSEGFALIGRVGVLAWKAELDAAVNGGADSDSQSGQDVFIGLGFEAGGPTLAVRLDYTRYSLDDSDLDSLALSLVIRPSD
jgi:OmpA-like transmembrane domain